MAAEVGNKYAIGNNGGRPPIWGSVEELNEKITTYFNDCKDQNIKATITGLALYLGFDSRQSLYDYEKKEEFSYVIKRAKLAVENSYEMGGTAFDIFALKNMGWKDKQEVENRYPDGLKIKHVYQDGNDPLVDE